MSMKINRLEIENVKRIKAVKIEPRESGLTIIGGNNNQGKTSVLDSIAWALGGERFKPSQATREGSVIPPNLHIVMNNGLIVERKGKNSALKVTDPNGNKGGQQLLNEFVEQLALDLPKFMESSGKEKAQTLLQIIGVGDQLLNLEKEEKELYQERLYVGRTANQKEKFAKEQPYFPEAPKDLVFVPGSSVRTYTDEQLGQMIKKENTSKEYNGKQYTTYEALQQQRKMERAMRAQRQKIKLLQEGDADPDEIILAKEKYQGQMQAYSDFSEKTGLPEQMKRITQDGLRGRFMLTKTDQTKIQIHRQEKENEKMQKLRKSKFSERFTEYNNGQKDVITIRRLMNNLNRTEIGKEVVSYIAEHPELDIQMCYKIDHEPGIRDIRMEIIFIYLLPKQKQCRIQRKL